MSVDSNEARDAVAELQEGEPLIAYLRERLGWEFRASITQDIPQPSAVCQEALGSITRGQEYYDRLVQHYRNSFFILDHFGKDHTARRQFRTEVLGEKSRWLRSISKLSGNNLGSCFIMMDAMITRLLSEGVIVDFSVERMNAVPKGSQEYNKLEFDEKVAYAEQVDELVYEFLVALSTATSAEGDEKA